MADWNLRWQAPFDHAWESETHYFPSYVELTAEGQKGAPDVRVRFEMRDGVPEVVEYQITAKADGRAVRTVDLNAWHLEQQAVSAFRRFARLKDPATARKLMDEGGLQSPYGALDERDHWSIGGDLERARTGKTGPSIAELEEVARVYREALDTRPTEAVQLHGSYSRRTAARRVQQARAAGLLPETTPGKKNG